MRHTSPLPFPRHARRIFAAALLAGLVWQTPPVLAQFGGGDAGLIEAIEDRDIDAFKLAIVNETRPTLRDSMGVPAIILAVEAREQFFVEELLKAGARPDDRPRRRDDSRTALTRAAELGEPGMVKALLDADADPDLPGDRNEPALIKAAHLGHIDVVRVLLDGGADLNITEMTGRTALEVAERSNQRGVVRLLQSAGAN